MEFQQVALKTAVVPKGDYCWSDGSGCRWFCHDSPVENRCLRGFKPSEPEDPFEIIKDPECARLTVIRPRICLAKPLRSIKKALHYWKPTRLTLKVNPRIHAWLWWNF